MYLPSPLNWLWVLWKKFAELLGRVMSSLILTVLWVIGFGAYAIMLKIANIFTSHKKPKTYWVDPPPDFPKSMKYQF